MERKELISPIGTNQGSFIINCRSGENPTYYFDSNSITANGYINYNIGFDFNKSNLE